MPRSKSTAGSLIHRGRQGGTIPFFEIFSLNLKMYEFTPITELYASYLALYRAKDTLAKAPSLATFSRVMASKFRPHQKRKDSKRGYGLVAEKM